MPSEDVRDAPPLELLRPAWPAPPGVVAGMSTRRGGIGAVAFDGPDLGRDRPGDTPEARAARARDRRRFARALGAEPVWLDQVHGEAVVRIGREDLRPGRPAPAADASVSTDAGVACTVLVADCLPVLLCSADGRAVGAAHAGWRGLAGGVVENTVRSLCEAAACAPRDLLAWLGPCIGARRFEVGADVLEAFGAAAAPVAQPHFEYRPRADGSARWLADLPGLARERLVRLGVREVAGIAACTFDDASRFFSFRREGRTGRMAAAVAIRGD